MAKNPETKFKEIVAADLRTLRHVWFYKTQEVAIHGIPDFILCINGYFVALELKVGVARGEPLQEYHLEKIRTAAKGRGFVVNPENWPLVFAKLRALDAA